MDEVTESIVIAGISGRLPESDNIDEFKQNLLDGLDFITRDDRRWPMGIYGLPAGFGKIKDLVHFDANFFGVNGKQAQAMDPQVRLLLEVTHEAIIDAGLNPRELRGSNTAVFIGSSFNDTMESSNSDVDTINGYGLLGACNSMIANRVSYAFDFKGPSFVVDSACSSSLLALHEATVAIKTGQCDAAIVGGVNLALRPNCTLQFHRLNLLSPDLKCKVFDANCNGYVKAEAVVTVFIQKASDARRVYATVLGTKTNNDGYKELGITYPSGQIQSQLTRELYAESGVDPLDVAYVEAHGTGTKAGDPEEVNSIVDVFCKNRKGPLLIGSVKSNMGHSEPTAGVSAIAKLVIAMECGIIPANLHYNSPNKLIPALLDGRLKVITENTKWNGGIVGVNSFGFGGSNVHVIISSNPKLKKSCLPGPIPRLITVSGRTEEAVQFFLDKINEQSYDEELYSLVDQIHKTNITGHNYRGYRLIGEDGLQEKGKVISEKRPIWFVFTGMGCQWPKMGKELMNLNPFKKSIQHSANTLRPFGIDLIDVIVNGDKATMEDLLYSFVGITSIQIALVDVIRLLKIEPDGIVGHSLGEIGCAYADRTISSQQAILLAYARAIAVLDSKLRKGMMAAVGLSWDECEKRVPSDVYLACHNSKDNVTVSGPPESIQTFTEELIKEGIFAKAVNVSGFAFHSKYVADAGPKLRKALDSIITEPKQRSSKWISSSIAKSDWNNPLAKTCSAAYLVNNLLSPVYFYEATRHIPDNAIVLEFAPHALLQAILRRSLGGNVTNIGLLKREHPDNVKYLLTNIGKVYMYGGQPDVAAVYPPVSFPVSKGTPMLGCMVKWDHSAEWPVVKLSGKGSPKLVVDIDIRKEEYQFLNGHVIDGRIIFPATGYLTLVWKALAKMKNQDFEQLNVVFEDVNFLRATIMPKEGSAKFLINILEGTGDFEISESGSVAVTGKIYVPDNIDSEFLNPTYHNSVEHADALSLNKDDIYKELRLGGYNYSGGFRGITNSDGFGLSGKLEWGNNWITFIDTMLQFSIFGQTIRDLYLPTRLQKVIINPKCHIELNLDNIPVYNDRNINVIKSGGIEIKGLEASLAPRRRKAQAAPKLEKYKFIPLENNDESSTNDALAVASQLVFENSSGVLKLVVIEIVTDTHSDALVLPKLLEIMEAEPMLYVDATIIASVPFDVTTLKEKPIKVTQKNVFEQNAHLVILVNTLLQENGVVIESAIASLKPGGFILFEETTDQSHLHCIKYSLEVIWRQVTKHKVYILARKIVQIDDDSIIIYTTKNDYSWIEPLKEAMTISENNGCKIYLVSQEDRFTGLIGMMNCIRKESGGINVRYIYIQDKTAEPFSIVSDYYQNQLRKDLVQNVLKNGIWGTFRHLLLDQAVINNKIRVKNACINILSKGDLSTLEWIEGPLAFYKDNPNSKLCTVYYSPLNFKDVMLATGKMSLNSLAGQDCILGLEFSGRDNKGKRVMGMVDARAMATTVLSHPIFLWDVPEKWSLEEASTIPTVYATAYYALIVRGRMRAGQSILIHAGAGGVGQASISIALHMGCKVFTTVSNQAKRDFLKKRFPQIMDECIGNSRNSSFEQMILTQTNGRGVDFVLNSLSGKLLHTSVSCLAEGGIFLEIGKADLLKHSQLDMSLFLKNAAFHGIVLDILYSIDSDDIREMSRLINEGINNGAVRPLPNTIFAENEVEQAFRFMASGKHIGKVSIKIRDEENYKIIDPSQKTISAIAKIYMDPDKVYIIVGGLGGFGLELTNWLINRGATKIVLSSRRGVVSGYQSLCIRRWKNQNVTIRISTVDITTAEGAETLLRESNTLGPVGAIFNLAVVLKDAMMYNQNEEDFNTVCRPKKDIIKHLDTASRKLTPHLDYFVVFSSVSSGRGNAGQANYGFANSAMERICEHRQEAGFPALAIQWGAIGDVGLVAETMPGVTELEGTELQSIHSCLSTLDIFLRQTHTVVSSIVLAEIRKTSKSINNITLINAVAKILSINDPKVVAGDSTFTDQGMDSLMATEIKQVLERNYDLALTAKEIRDLTFNKLYDFENIIKGPKAPVNTTTYKSSFDGYILPTDACVKMSNKETANKNPVFIIHPIEGTVDVLKDLAKNIEAAVYGLQCTLSAPLNSISDLANHYIKLIKKVQPRGPYILIAYSFGGCVGLEMGIQLEANNEKVKLLFIDGSPQYTITLLDQLKVRSSKQGIAFEEILLLHFLWQFTEMDSQKITAEFISMKNWDERVKRVIEIVATISDYPPSEISTAVDCFYKRVRAAHSYKPSAMFKGDAILVKASENFVNREEDYGLNSICKQRVTIEVLEGTHRTILDNPNIFKLANKFCKEV